MVRLSPLQACSDQKKRQEDTKQVQNPGNNEEQEKDEYLSIEIDKLLSDEDDMAD